MSDLLTHRGPDASGIWEDQDKAIGMIHRRLSIIDLSEGANQPMEAMNTVLTYNGEIYNYKDLHEKYQTRWNFKTHSDTETLLAAYHFNDKECLQELRGMFAFGLWNKQQKHFFAARDRFGIKPFYYAVVGEEFFFASEAKALLPFLPGIETDYEALNEYFTFQYTIGEKTLFKGIKQLMPGYFLTIHKGCIDVNRYWDVHYNIDFDHSSKYFKRELQEKMAESAKLHMVGDVDLGCYLSGGVDSSLILGLASNENDKSIPAFTGLFSEYDGFDESGFAKIAAQQYGASFNTLDIGNLDFKKHIHDVIYHLDYPVAGPGSFAQYMISKLASEQVKVVLGGQGGDEIFGGYARYTIAYLEQCLKAAIDGTYKNGNFVVTIESIIPNLGMLREYKPMLKQFWQKGLFEEMDKRYFQLVDRSVDMESIINKDILQKEKVFRDFQEIFNNRDNVSKHAYFDQMTHYDFKCFLPSLLQVEDRMSMAHGLESRVPFLDHPLVEFAATIPADVKFKNGKMKRLLSSTFSNIVPKEILSRRDKMGFPVPVNLWFEKDLSGFFHELFVSMYENKRPYLDMENINSIKDISGFSRKTWGLVSLEIWHQVFHDNADKYAAMAKF